MKRKHFILMIIAICSVALIAEIILLAGTLNKKKTKEPEKGTEKENVTATATPSPTEVPTPEVTYQKVWKLAKESGSEAWMNTTYYEYDDQGRECRRVLYDNGSLAAKETYLLSYDRSGMIIMEKWIPDESGTMESKSCFFATAAYSSGNELWYIHPYYESGEIIDDLEYDENHNLVAVYSSFDYDYDTGKPYTRSEWVFDSDGHITKHIVKDKTGYRREYEFLYDEKGRMLKAGDDVCFHYVGNKSFSVFNGNGIIVNKYEDGKAVGYAREGDYSAWDRMTNPDDPDYTVTDGYEAFDYRSNGNFPYDVMGVTFWEKIRYSYPKGESKWNGVGYHDAATVVWESKMTLRDDGQPKLLESFYNPNGLMPLSDTPFQTTRFVYDENDMLSKTVTVHADGTTEEMHYSFDENGNLTELRYPDGTRYYYEWVEVTVPVTQE